MTPAGIQKDNLARIIPWMAAATLGTVLLAIGARLCLEYGMAWQCPAIVLFGLPCPSCGSTRAFAALADLNLLSALRFNPLVVIGLIGLPLFTFARYVPQGLKRHGWIIFATLVVLNWLYLFLFLPR